MTDADCVLMQSVLSQPQPHGIIERRSFLGKDRRAYDIMTFGWHSYFFTSSLQQLLTSLQSLRTAVGVDALPRQALKRFQTKVALCNALNCRTRNARRPLDFTRTLMRVWSAFLAADELFNDGDILCLSHAPSRQ